jgi:hypothetical protein
VTWKRCFEKHDFNAFPVVEAGKIPAQIRIVKQNHHIIETVSALVTEHGNGKKMPINIVLPGISWQVRFEPLVR